MNALLELAARCEAATGPDRDLDYDIQTKALGKAPNLYGFQLDPFTRSIDAAMTLVPEGLDPQICKGPMFALAANEQRPWGVSLIGNAHQVESEYGPEMGYDSFDANATTAALALCAAALRARSEAAAVGGR